MIRCSLCLELSFDGLLFSVVKVGIDTALSGLSLNIDNINAGYSPNGNMTAISLMHVSGTGGPPKCATLVSMFPLSSPPYNFVADGVVSQMPLTGSLHGINLADK